MDIWLFNSDVSPCLLVLWNSTKLTIANRNLQKHVNSFNMMVSKTRVRFPHAPLFDSWKDNSFSSELYHKQYCYQTVIVNRL